MLPSTAIALMKIMKDTATKYGRVKLINTRVALQLFNDTCEECNIMADEATTMQKPIVYRQIDIWSNYELFELLDYLESKGVITSERKFIGKCKAGKFYGSFDELKKEQLQKEETFTKYDSICVEILFNKYLLLEHIEDAEMYGTLIVKLNTLINLNK